MKEKSEKEDNYDYQGYVLVDQGHPPVVPSPQLQSGLDQYEVPDLPEMSDQFLTTRVGPPPFVGASEEREGETHVEAVYELILGDK